MADGYIDVIFLVVCFRDGVECRDRPALDNIKCIINQTPLDVLGATKVFFDRSAQALELQKLLMTSSTSGSKTGSDSSGSKSTTGSGSSDSKTGNGSGTGSGSGTSSGSTTR